MTARVGRVGDGMSAIYPAGKLLQEILIARGLTQALLADAMGRPPQMVSEIATGKKQITPATAVDLEAALAVPAEIWLTTQALHNVRAVKCQQPTKEGS